MNNLRRVLLVLIACCGSTLAEDGVIHSRWANSDPRLDTNPMSSFWRGSEPVSMESDALGKNEPKYRTEIRARWTKQNLYFLFVCPYEELNLTPNPKYVGGDERALELGCRGSFHRRGFQEHKTVQRIRDFTARRVGRSGYRSRPPT